MSGMIAFAAMFLGVLGLTGWIFYVTQSPWSFLILLLAMGMQYTQKH